MSARGGWVFGRLEWDEEPSEPKGLVSPEDAALTLSAALGADDPEMALGALAAGRAFLEASGETALGRACSVGSFKCVVALLAAGELDRARWDDPQADPMALAVGSRSLLCVEAVMGHAKAAGMGAEAARSGVVAALSSKAWGGWALALLDEPGAFDGREARAKALAAAIAHGEDVEPLLSRGWDPDMELEGSRGWMAPALDLACEAERWDACAALLGAGASLRNDRWRMEERRLGLAARAGNLRAVKALLAAGEDPGGVDASGKTALMSAQGEDVARALLSAGADPAFRSKNGKGACRGGWDALDWAIARGSIGAIKALVREVDPRGRVDEDGLVVAAGFKMSQGPALDALERGARKWEAQDEARELARDLEEAAVSASPRSARL